jgi:hypothetical protein
MPDSRWQTADSRCQIPGPRRQTPNLSRARRSRLLLALAFGIWHLASGIPSACLAEKFHDAPPGGPGGITLDVQPINDLEEAVVVEATEYKAYVANIDRAAGRVSIKGLPFGKYDLLLKFKDKVYEGLTLDAPSGIKPMSKELRDGIEHVTWVSEDMFNEKRIARLAGNDKEAKLLVEQIRDKRTFMPDGTLMKDTMIRRFDLCEMRKTGKIWQVKMNRHLFREERKMGGPGTKIDFCYVPELGGIRVGDDMATAPAFDASKFKPRQWPSFYSAHYREKEGGASKPK